MLKIGKGGGKAPVQKNTAAQQETPAASENALPRKATVIGENISIEGVITAGEDLTIEGSLCGGVIAKSHQLTIGKSGRVEADVQAETVVVSGRMKGSIVAWGKVQINQGADFTGQIKAKSISVEDGSMLKATIELDRDIREKPHVAPQHRIEAIIFPAEGHGDKSPLREISQPASKN
jgi:cytoskeletal protein CcmA (bactofilin family)